MRLTCLIQHWTTTNIDSSIIQTIQKWTLIIYHNICNLFLCEYLYILQVYVHIKRGKYIFIQL